MQPDDFSPNEMAELEAELRELERTDPDVAMAARLYDETVQEILQAHVPQVGDAERSRCQLCGYTIFEGDSGWFHQHPVELPTPDGTKLVFNDRITTCPQES